MYVPGMPPQSRRISAAWGSEIARGHSEAGSARPEAHTRHFSSRHCILLKYQVHVIKIVTYRHNSPNNAGTTRAGEYTTFRFSYTFIIHVHLKLPYMYRRSNPSHNPGTTQGGAHNNSLFLPVILAPMLSSMSILVCRIKA